MSKYFKLILFLFIVLLFVFVKIKISTKEPLPNPSKSLTNINNHESVKVTDPKTKIFHQKLFLKDLDNKSYYLEWDQVAKINPETKELASFFSYEPENENAPLYIIAYDKKTLNLLSSVQLDFNANTHPLNNFDSQGNVTETAFSVVSTMADFDHVYLSFVYLGTDAGDLKLIVNLMDGSIVNPFSTVPDYETCYEDEIYTEKDIFYYYCNDKNNGQSIYQYSLARDDLSKLVYSIGDETLTCETGPYIPAVRSKVSNGKITFDICSSRALEDYLNNGDPYQMWSNKKVRSATFSID